MTEFLPEGEASPSAVPAPAPAYDYASAPPRATNATWAHFQPALAPARKGPPWWVWLIVGGVTISVVMVVVAFVAIKGQIAPSYSAGYTGAPVEASDAVPPAVVSDSATVAYDADPEWVEAADYIDLSKVTASLTQGTALLGMHFTSDPDVKTPQLVMVLEGAPDAVPVGSLDKATTDYFTGLHNSGAVFVDPPSTAITTANGLEGRRAEFEAKYGDTPVQNVAVILAHGRRFVFVQWTSYSGPVDEAALTALIESIRIDE